ncbi:hypothetical protein [Kibdelosporangium phytohabitans]|uniref:Uncharacterized protein n=1 Tax=Kibdelosporangium phytohabitans TaxID=860235 RepID=A0A0N9I9S8_9PSEU|nr:hypothetical protein [Kibdelosporangium phytohabitans]ALG11756.1 hypothetical protein AOZ06_37150 [Kibdelosporangium phytohabitans]MBE1463159.1 hypothetical protein [Kibdelosporangium phytohabitans]
MPDEPTTPSRPPTPGKPGAQPEALAQATTPLDPPAAARPEAPPQADQTAAHGAEAPPPPPPPPPPPVAARTPGGFGRFVRHRATQIVAAGLAGLVIGGGVVALVDRDGPRGRDNYGYHGRFDDRGPRGGGPYWDRPDRDFRDGPGPRAPRPAPNPPAAPTTPSTPPTTG